MYREWKRIVIKLGTNVLTDQKGHLDLILLEDIVSQISELKKNGIEIAIVSSGAVGAGKSFHSLPESVNKITKRQVYSAIGQVELMRRYQLLFLKHSIHCAQVLTTKEDFRDRSHYINMKRCMLALLRDKVIPIINENDVTSITELMFTDNDELAFLSSSLINADTLVILTNVDGLMTSKEGGSLIPVVESNNKEVYKFVGGEKSSFGRGGMLTKISLAQKASKLGIQCYISNGKKDKILYKLKEGTAPCTYFKPEKRKSAIKKWIALTEERTNGKLIVNEGAEKTLKDPDKIASLLPVGIVECEGDFRKGALLDICNIKNEKIGVGIAAINSDTLIHALGKTGAKPAVHYNYLHIFI